ncbi:MAG: hypothetical protein QOI20_484 [Acidimicrobiaceae bacterium]|jgi:hypothetical protein|nr:hypothetical protein [Acidimicrobiaceae bacterium]
MTAPPRKARARYTSGVHPSNRGPLLLGGRGGLLANLFLPRAQRLRIEVSG